MVALGRFQTARISLQTKADIRVRAFLHSLQANQGDFIQYDWLSKLQTLNDYMAEMDVLS